MGFAMPAEWERHAATWLSWPHNPNTWPGQLDKAWPYWVTMARELSRGETVHIVTPNEAIRAEADARLRTAGLASALISGTVVLHVAPTNDSWMRDCGPIFVARVGKDGGREILALDFGYNAWGGKYPPFTDDDKLPLSIGQWINCAVVQIPHIMEGGSIDVNGAGSLLTSESCLLNPNRNPSLDRDAIEKLLIETTGATNILWIADGIAGDDTDGHIDDTARFLDARTIAHVVETNPKDENHKPLQEVAKRLKAMRDVQGRPFTLVELPMPKGRYNQGQRMPASPANFYIGNDVVLVPTFGDPNDAVCLSQLRQAFTSRRVVGIDCTDLVWGLGAFHCVTQQQPLGRLLPPDALTCP